MEAMRKAQRKYPTRYQLKGKTKERLIAARELVKEFPCPDGVSIGVLWGSSQEPMGYRAKGLVPFLKLVGTDEEVRARGADPDHHRLRSTIRPYRGETALECVRAWMAGVLADAGASPSGYEIRDPKIAKFMIYRDKIEKAFNDGVLFRERFGKVFGLE